MTRIVFLSDLHLPARRGSLVHGMDPWAALGACLRDIAALPGGLDLVVVGGDLLTDGAAGDYGEVGRELLGLAAPVHVAMGNHDDREVFAATAPPQLLASRPSGRAHYSFAHRDLRLVILDSTVCGGPDGGALGGAQLEWLARDLAAYAERRILVFLHHPPVDVGVAWLDAIGLRDREELWQALGSHRGRLAGVFCSHVHMSRALCRDSALVATSPSTAFQFCGLTGKEKPSDEPPGYLVIDVLGDTVVAQAKRFTP